MASMKVSISAWKQAKSDREQSSKNPVRRLSDMTPEERQKVIEATMAVDRERAKRRAITMSGLLPSKVAELEKANTAE